MLAPAARRILIIRPSALGDAARTVAVLYSLRRAYPGATIEWLIQDTFADVVRAHPDLSGVVPFPRRAFGRWIKTGRVWRVCAFLRMLRDRRYDLVLDAQGLARSALFARATAASVRVGYADARELGWLAMTHRVSTSAEAHTVDRMLSLVTALGVPAFAGAEAMRLHVPPEDDGWANRQPFLRGRYAVIAPTSRWPGKQWPDDRFAVLCRALALKGVSVLVVGAAGERSQIPGTLALAGKESGVIDLVGKTTLGQLMSVIRGSSLVVANDSAALHIAAGFDRPLLGLYGPTRVHRVGPYRRERDVVQHVKAGEWTRHEVASRAAPLMARISVEEVVALSLARLGASGASRGPG